MKSIMSFGCVLGLLFFFSSCLKNSDPAPSLFDQWVRDTTAIGEYIRTNKIPALKDPSGIYFVIQSPGTGFPPRISSSVSFTYTGKLMNGTQFGQGNSNGLVSGFNDGFRAALTLMQKGTKATFYIPSVYADGSPGTATVPANTNMIYEIDMINVVVTEFDKQQLASDTVEIDNYLSMNAINAVRDPSGLRYVITQMGAGPQPGLYSRVKINYTGRLMSTGNVFFSGTSSPGPTFYSRVINYIYGIQVALTKMPVGTRATLYVPSPLGFGNQTIGNSVPANSNLIYDLEIVERVD
jgi:FKBP-type peptidyl-prolyl cis-trans isomerase